jgi:hypothetical protein
MPCLYLARHDMSRKICRRVMIDMLIKGLERAGEDLYRLREVRGYSSLAFAQRYTHPAPDFTGDAATRTRSLGIYLPSPLGSL